MFLMRIGRCSASFFVAVFFAFFIICTPLFSQISKFRITEISGDVSVEKDGKLEKLSSDTFNCSSSTKILTGSNSLVYFSNDSGIEIKIKDDSCIILSASGELTIDSGIVGVRARPDLSLPKDSSFSIVTKHLKSVLKEGIIAVKTGKILSQLAVLKGWTLVSTVNNEHSLVKQKEEVAAGEYELSQKYLSTDELFYAFYWK
ncbi:MAG: hypothetical protein HQM10_05300 [Candidatus Riflebacteria bacterium]|nr:hypothetical protein [Candidatus Riflebacteria bacterium]